jgi:hypothetical protein
MRNIKNCWELYKIFKLGKETKINGTTYGGQQNIQHKTITGTSTSKYNPQNPSFGFGAQDAAIS